MCIWCVKNAVFHYMVFVTHASVEITYFDVLWRPAYSDVYSINYAYSDKRLLFDILDVCGINVYTHVLRCKFASYLSILGNIVSLRSVRVVNMHDHVSSERYFQKYHTRRTNIYS